MPYRMNPKQLAAVSRLPGPLRYEHFVQRVIDWKEVWGLASEAGWVMAGDDDGHETFPVWPHPDYAAACATGPWAGSEPRLIRLKDFLAKWLPGMDGDGKRVAVFPTPAIQGVVVEPLRLKADLEGTAEPKGEDE